MVRELSGVCISMSGLKEVHASQEEHQDWFYILSTCHQLA